MSGGIYVGNLDRDTTDKELERLFDKFGKITECKIRSNAQRGTTFGFVTFDDARDAEEAVDEMNGYMFDRQKLFVQINHNEKGRGGMGPPDKPDTRLWVGNLPRETNEKELRQMFEEFGTTCQIAVRSNPSIGHTFGFVEYQDARDAQDAIAAMNGKEIRGTTLRVELTRPSGGPRRGPPPGRGYGGGGYGGGRYGDDRGGYGGGYGGGGYGGGGYGGGRYDDRGGYGGGGGYGRRDYRDDRDDYRGGRDRGYDRGYGRRSPSPRRRSRSPYRSRSRSPYYNKRRRDSRSFSPRSYSPDRKRRRSYSR
eukprot:TRINITY_DN63495_c0_g1_i1.p1 TRINITY_DN63495_c0_g1~~TRINITY_DN63495_c0_g1_i1.p1  ORF type:complete len:320 (-),score=29.67 TRINITY_DN63495_c0_g1_i1:167-1090(-)